MLVSYFKLLCRPTGVVFFIQMCRPKNITLHYNCRPTGVFFIQMCILFYLQLHAHMNKQITNKHGAETYKLNEEYAEIWISMCMQQCEQINIPIFMHRIWKHTHSWYVCSKKIIYTSIYVWFRIYPMYATKSLIFRCTELQEFDRRNLRVKIGEEYISLFYLFTFGPLYPPAASFFLQLSFTILGLLNFSPYAYTPHDQKINGYDEFVSCVR